MLIDVCPGWMIDNSDEPNWTVYRITHPRTGKQAGQEVKTAVAYCSTLQNALRKIAQLIMASDKSTKTVVEALEALEGILVAFGLQKTSGGTPRPQDGHPSMSPSATLELKKTRKVTK